MSDNGEKNLEQLKAAVDFAKQAISFAFLLNGGALIGMLTFIGNAIDKLPKENLTELASSSGLFILGLVSATLASIVAYIAQLNYFKIDSGLPGKVVDPTFLRYALIVLLVAAVLLFSLGSLQALNGISVDAGQE